MPQDFITTNPASATFSQTADRLREQRLEDEQLAREAGVDLALRKGVMNVFAAPQPTTGGSQPVQAVGQPAPAPARGGAPAAGGAAPPSLPLQPVIRGLANTEGGGQAAFNLLQQQRGEVASAEQRRVDLAREDRKREDEMETAALEALRIGDMVTFNHFASQTDLDIPQQAITDARTRGLMSGGLLIGKDFYEDPEQLGRFAMGYMRSGGNIETAWNQAGGPPIEKPEISLETVMINGERRLLRVDQLGNARGLVEFEGQPVESTTASARTTQLIPSDIALMRDAEKLVADIPDPDSFIRGARLYTPGTDEFNQAVLATVARWKADPAARLAELESRGLARGDQAGVGGVPDPADPAVGAGQVTTAPTAAPTDQPAAAQPAPAPQQRAPLQPGPAPTQPTAAAPAQAPTAGAGGRAIPFIGAPPSASLPDPGQPTTPTQAGTGPFAVPTDLPAPQLPPAPMVGERTPTPIPTPPPPRGIDPVRAPTQPLRQPDQGPPAVTPLTAPQPAAAPPAESPQFITGGQASMNPQPPPDEPMAVFVGYSAGDVAADGTPLPAGLPIFRRPNGSEFIFIPE